MLRYVILLLAGLAVTSQLPAAPPYINHIERSRWISEAAVSGCRLTHQMPLFGVAVFSQNAVGDLSLDVYAHRPPLFGERAELLARAPVWQPPREEPIDSARIYAEAPLLRLSHYTAQRVLATLERGQLAVVRFADNELEIALSPVRFQEGLRAHLDCLAQLKAAPAEADRDPLIRMGYRSRPSAGSLRP
jgi:hypothetical protein